MQTGQSEAVSRGAARLFLEVAEDNFAARKLYAALGFGAVGRRAAYYERGSLGKAAAYRDGQSKIDARLNLLFAHYETVDVACFALQRYDLMAFLA